MSNWSDIKVFQFIELFNISEDYSKYELIIHQLSILLDKPYDEIDNMYYEDIEALMTQYEWILTPPKSKPTNKLTIQGVDFHLINDFNSITLGEFIDLEYFFQDGYVKNLTTILAILYRPILSEESILYPTKYAPYDYDPRYRAHLFDEISIDLFYGVINSYLNWRNRLLSDYHGLFNVDSNDDNDEEVLDGLTGVEKAEMIKALEAEKRQKKWSWTLFLYALADNDALKIDEAAKLPILGALNIYSMRQELNMQSK